VGKKRIVIFLPGGLGNRLRAMLAFVHIAEVRNLFLDVVWRLNRYCNGSFLDNFLPLENVEFWEEQPPHEDGEYVIKQEKCNKPFHVYLKEQLNIDLNYSHVNHPIYTHLWSKIRPRPHIRKAVEDFVRQNDIGDCIGVQIRRTDHGPFQQGDPKHASDRYFAGLIRERSSQRVLLCTDNRETQDHYSDLFGDRILSYRPIEGGGSSLRHTTLEHAVVDKFILSFCKKIFRPYLSSFGQAALYLKASYAVRGL
jgi:hypothetical protein